MSRRTATLGLGLALGLLMTPSTASAATPHYALHCRVITTRMVVGHRYRILCAATPSNRRAYVFLQHPAVPSVGGFTVDGHVTLWVTHRIPGRVTYLAEFSTPFPALTIIGSNTIRVAWARPPKAHH